MMEMALHQTTSHGAAFHHTKLLLGACWAVGDELRRSWRGIAWPDLFQRRGSIQQRLDRVSLRGTQAQCYVVQRVSTQAQADERELRSTAHGRCGSLHTAETRRAS